MNIATVDPSHLLIQLEGILESDPHIDEVGLIHPTQFAAFSEEVHNSPSLSSGDESTKSEPAQDNISDTYFWHNEHKLGISTLVLVLLYRAAKDAFMDSYKRFKMSNNSQYMKDERIDDNASMCSTSFLDFAEIEVMRHSRALLLLSCDFGTAWNSRKLIVSKKLLFSMFMDELSLSALVLSYSPKSERAWSHRVNCAPIYRGKHTEEANHTGAWKLVGETRTRDLLPRAMPTPPLGHPQGDKKFDIGKKLTQSTLIIL